MSINLAGIPVANYIGSPYGMPVQIGGTSGRAVAISINWLSYGVSSLVNQKSISLSLFGNNVALLSRVRSVYIDNTNSNVPIYVTAPDTGHTIACAPQSAQWSPIITNGYTFTITGIGFVTGQIPSTQIFFTDIFIPPNSDIAVNQSIQLLLGSTTITNKNNPEVPQGFGTPSLGDQTFVTNYDLSTTVDTIIDVWSNLPQPNFVYLKSLKFWVCGAFWSGGPVFSNLSVKGSVSPFQFEAVFYVTGTPANVPNTLIRSLECNVQLSTNQQWVVHNGNQITAGVGTVEAVFSINSQG